MNPIKPTLRTELVPIILLVIIGIASWFFYQALPDIVPIHWNIAGEPDQYGSKIFSAFVFPLIILGIYALLLFAPLIDPRKERYLQFAKVYHMIKAYFVLMFACIYFLANLNALGYNLPIGLWIPVLVGILFVIIGNYMGKLRKNWFIGIRNPWTLSSEETWNKTHRVGGKLFIVSGLLMIANGFAPVSYKLPLFITSIVLVIGGTFGYSYWVYRQEKKANHS